MSGDTSLRELIERIAAEEGVSVADLKGRSRTPSIAWPRHRFMAEAYALGRYSTTQIGRFLDGRDHTTVIHDIRAHRARQARDAAPVEQDSLSQ